MNPTYLIRLLIKNAFLIFGIALLLALIVYLSTVGQPKSYPACSTLYLDPATCHDKRSPGNRLVDSHSNQAQLDNFISIAKSRETQEQTAILLIASHLILAKPDPMYCLPETWRALKSEVPDEIMRLVELTLNGSNRPDSTWTPYEQLVKNLTELKNADQDNYLFKTLHSSNRYYSVRKISELKVSRIRNSAILKLSYVSDDPAVCVQTLKTLIRVLNLKFQAIAAAQTGPSPGYFRQRAAAAKWQLDSLAENLLQFRMKNRIVDYDEQTAYFLDQKETIDRQWYEETGKLTEAKAALALIGESFGEKGKVILQDSTIRQKWLDQSMVVEECRARLKALTLRKNDFLRKYDELASLGSQLKKAERDIEIAREEYVNCLNNLNQSIIKQKGIEQSVIQVIDNPVYPLKADASGRLIAVMATFCAGLVLMAFIILLLELLDTSIKFPDRLARLSGLKLLGAFPLLPAKADGRINYPLISSNSIEQITFKIRMEDLRLKNRGEQPFVLFFISTRDKEGKTFLATRVVEKLRASGSTVLYIKPLEKNSTDEIKRQFASFDQEQQAWDFEYAVPDNFFSIRNVNELLRNYTFLTKGYHYLVIELPPLLVKEFPATLAQSGSMTILVGHAARTWKRADGEAIKLYQSSGDHPVLALLNGCRADLMEPAVGDIPKRRSLLKKLIR